MSDNSLHWSQWNFLVWYCENGLTSSTAHSLPPARFMSRWVRWAKMSGVAHISPWNRGRHWSQKSMSCSANGNHQVTPYNRHMLSKTFLQNWHTYIWFFYYMIKMNSISTSGSPMAESKPAHTSTKSGQNYEAKTDIYFVFYKVNICFPNDTLINVFYTGLTSYATGKKRWQKTER